MASHYILQRLQQDKLSYIPIQTVVQPELNLHLNHIRSAFVYEFEVLSVVCAAVHNTSMGSPVYLQWALTGQCLLGYIQHITF